MHRAQILRQLADEIETGTDWTINTRHRAFIKDKVKSEFGDLPMTRWDREYKCIIKPHFKQFLEHSWANTREYLKEHHDCDDFAKALWADATLNGITGIGLVTNDSHAFNIAVYPGSEPPDLVEPQNDSLVTPGDGLYSMENAEIIF